jgi:choline dehydrogenase-like flavoprotein
MSNKSERKRGLPMLSKEWNKRIEKYDFVVIGSGYGGAITAARIASAALNPARTVCILERGKEWPVGTSIYLSKGNRGLPQSSQ